MFIAAHVALFHEGDATASQDDRREHALSDCCDDSLAGLVQHLAPLPERICQDLPRDRGYFPCHLIESPLYRLSLEGTTHLWDGNVSYQTLSNEATRHVQLKTNIKLITRRYYK